MNNPEDRTHLTISETASRWGVSASLIRHMIQDGRLPTTRFGRTIRISKAAVEEFERRSTSTANGSSPPNPKGHVLEAAPAKVIFKKELGKIRKSREGERNTTLNRAAFSLGVLVGRGALNVKEVRNALIDAGIATGIGRAEVMAAVKSWMKAGCEQASPDTSGKPDGTPKTSGHRKQP
ncbi:MAG TPA: helix-turn-helix domain-containing protein [Myxococcota bacterium]|nr:helix-turn-helix domain-containing protein [Myxococcota bacterium]HRY93574.1 helix-turn-helix domain-containing protein [Myxococcota bacterium]